MLDPPWLPPLPLELLEFGFPLVLVLPPDCDAGLPYDGLPCDNVGSPCVDPAALAPLKFPVNVEAAVSSVCNALGEWSGE